MRRWKNEAPADLAVALVLFGPVSFFLLASAGCLDAAERNRWWEAGL